MRNSKAFSLAETLITLAIIGVVSVMAIPPLITNVKDRAFASAKENSFALIKEATHEMNTQGVLNGYTSNSAFVDEFKKYISVIKTCTGSNLTNCFSDTIYDADGNEVDTSSLTTGTKLGSTNLSDNTIAMMLKNGTSLLFTLKDATDSSNTASCKWLSPYDNTSNTTGCMSFLYDVNGFAPPNVMGRDIGSVSVSGLVCGGYKTADGTCFAGAFTPTLLTLAECNAQKATLGISACSSDTDYWAGAVAQCGGISNMPTQEQLDQLATELYGVTCGTSTCWGTLDYDKASSIGLPSSGGFYVWSSAEYSANSAYGRNFYSTGSNRLNGNRESSTFRAVCLGD